MNDGAIFFFISAFGKWEKIKYLVKDNYFHQIVLYNFCKHQLKQYSLLCRVIFMVIFVKCEHWQKEEKQ